MSDDGERRRPSGAEFPWLQEPPATPTPGDGTQFFTGPCLLYCQGRIGQVFYCGTIQVPGTAMHAQICQWCARQLQQVVLAVRARDDIGRLPPPGP